MTDVDLYLDDFLSHHGVKGMKWGVRKAEPTGGGSSNTRPPKTLPPGLVALSVQSGPVYKLVKNLGKTKVTQAIVKSAKTAEEAKQLQAGLFGVQLAALGAYKFVESGTARQVSRDARARLHGKTELGFSKNADFAKKNLSSDQILHDVVQGPHPINPWYGLPGTKQNCRRATLAYEMRRRGYNVQATLSTRATGQTTSGLKRAITPGSHRNTSVPGEYAVRAEQAIRVKTGHLSKSKTLRGEFGKGLMGQDFVYKTGREGYLSLSTAASRKIESFPKGARGELSVRWKMGGGHSVAWENVGGKAVIFDCQSGKRLDGASLAMFNGMGKSIGLTRLDNKELNTDFLQRWVKDVKS